MRDTSGNFLDFRHAGKNIASVSGINGWLGRFSARTGPPGTAAPYPILRQGGDSGSRCGLSLSLDPRARQG